MQSAPFHDTLDPSKIESGSIEILVKNMKQGKEKKSLPAMAKGLAGKLKTYWKTPPEGYQANYREVATFAAGAGSSTLMGILSQYTTIATSVHLMISYFRMSTGMAWILGILAAVCAVVRSPILSMMIDNSNGKRGKFKRFLLPAAIGAAISFSFVPYIPEGWLDIELFCLTLPAIPLMGVHETSALSFNVGILLAFLLIQIGSFFLTLMNQCITGLEQTITPVAQERANISSIKGLVSGLPSSIVNIILPILAGSVFAAQGGWNAVEMYRIAFPVCGVGAVLLVSVLTKGVQERIVVRQDYVAKVRFSEGMKILSKCKYFWIITLFNALNTVRALSNITAWITQYSFTSNTAKTIVGLYCSTLLMNAIAIALFCGPFLIKKLGKRNLMLATCVCYAVMIGLQLIFYQHPVVILIVSFFQQFCGGYYYLSGLMTSDALDELQRKTGKRLEGFWQNYMAIITTVIGIFTSVLTPLFLSFGGVGFSDDISVALQNDTLRSNIFFYQSLLSLLGAVVLAIPFFFYDLTEKKHASVIRALRFRAAADNLQTDTASAEDLDTLRELIVYADKNEDPLLRREIAQYSALSEKLTPASRQMRRE